MSIRRRIVAATPMICIIVYLAIGFIANIWHPTWVVFFFIPIMPMILCDNFYKGIYPIFCLIVYIGLGLVWKYWHPGWLIFLTIPVYYTLFGPSFNNLKKKKRVEFVER